VLKLGGPTVVAPVAVAETVEPRERAA
jgi:hypothetical protein